MNLSRLSLIFSFILAPLYCFAQNGSHNSFDPSKANYLWPTDASPYLTSTFAETRSAHFHSALDLKTWGRKGYNVFATRDGILHRIAIGPKGYGKVIYLKHDDGSYSVYAHLLRFEESIQQLADSIRFQNYSFDIDHNIEYLNIKVNQGDVIGLTGASGIGPPHLHFELRTPSHEPFNPLLTNLSIEDTIAPKFSRISIEPLSIESNIEGNNQIFTKRAWRKNENYTFGTIDLSGPIGLGVDVFDQANGVYNAYAVYELQLFVDDSLRFHSKVDQFSYHETNQMFVDRVYPLLEKYNAGYQRLFIKEGNTLSFYKSGNTDAKLNLFPGNHRIKVVAKDYAGNKQIATAILRVAESAGRPVQTKQYSSKQIESTPLSPDEWTWFDHWVNIPEEQAQNLVIAVSDSSNIINSNNRVQVKLDKSKDVFFRGSNNSHFSSRRVVSDSLSYLASTTDNSFVRFEPGTFYENVFSGLYIQHLAPDSIKMKIMPSSQPLKQAFRLAVELDSIQQKMPRLSVYSFDDRKQELSYLNSKKAKGYLFAYPEQLGTFFVLQDTAPPSLTNPKLHKREDGQWLVYIEAEDNLSGINYKTAQISVNKVKGIAEFEPEDDRLVYYYPDFEPSENMRITVSVEDREGNKTKSDFQLTKE